MIDVAGIAFFVIWMSKNPEWNNRELHRPRLVLQQLGCSLIDAHVAGRSQNLPAMQRDLRLCMQPIGISLTHSRFSSISESGQRQRYKSNTRERDRKIAIRCNNG